MAGSIAAELAILFKGDTSKLEGDLKKLEGTTGGLGKMMGGLGTAIAAGAAAGAVGIAGLGGAAVKVAADFEQGMSNIGAVSGATSSEMKSIHDLALKLGAETAFSASEAAAGIEELIKGGLSIEDVMKGGAKATLDLAAAGGVGLAEAATISANAMAQFGLAGDDVGHVADLIAGAANASAISVGDFGYSLKAAGAVANVVGFSFDDLAEGIAIMGKAGITGSDAGTSLKTMMMNLQPSTKKATGLFKELGLITADGSNKFFDATGKVKGMSDVAQVLQDSLKGMTEQQKIATLESLFGSDAIRAGAVLAKEGAAGFDEMAGSMSKVTAASVGADKMNNLRGAIQALMGSVETGAIIIGEALLPAIRKGTDLLNGFIGSVLPKLGPAMEGIGATLGSIFDSIDWAGIQAIVGQAFTVIGEAIGSIDWKLIGDLIMFIGKAFMDGMGVVIPIVVPILQALWNILEPLIPIIGLVGGAFLLLSNPIGIAVLAITAIGAAVNLLGPAWESVKAMLADLGAAISAKWEEFKAVISGALASIGESVTTAWAEFTSGISLALSLIGAAISTKWEEFKTTITGALQAIAEQIRLQWDAFLRNIQEKLDAILLSVSTAWDAVKTSVSEALEALKTAMTDAWGRLQSIVSDTLDAIKGVVDTALGAVKDIFDTQIEGIKNIVSIALDLITGNWQGALDTVHRLVDTALANLSGLFTTILGALPENVATLLSGVIIKVTEWGTNIKNAISGIASNALAWAADIGTNIVEGIKSKLVSTWDDLMAKLKAIVDLLPQVVKDLLGIKSPSSVFAEIGRNIVLGMAQGITGATGLVISAVRDLGQEVIRAAGGQSGGGMGKAVRNSIASLVVGSFIGGTAGMGTGYGHVIRDVADAMLPRLGGAAGSGSGGISRGNVGSGAEWGQGQSSALMEMVLAATGSGEGSATSATMARKMRRKMNQTTRRGRGGYVFGGFRDEDFWRQWHWPAISTPGAGGGAEGNVSRSGRAGTGSGSGAPPGTGGKKNGVVNIAGLSIRNEVTLDGKIIGEIVTSKSFRQAVQLYMSLTPGTT